MTEWGWKTFTAQAVVVFAVAQDVHDGDALGGDVGA